MSNQAQKALKLFQSGFSCSQAAAAGLLATKCARLVEDAARLAVP